MPAAPYQPASATECCAAALERGTLIRTGNDWHWRWSFGRRAFSHATVNALIAQGFAVRDGHVVRRLLAHV